MNETYGDFVSFLRENRERIRDDLIMPESSPRRDLYSDSFRRNFLSPPSDGFNRNISATDSSEFVRELYNGKKIILVRSYTSAGKNIYSSFVPRVMNVGRDDLQRFITMLMEHSEHMSVLRMLEKETPGMVLIDGSISGRINRERRRLVAEGYTEFHNDYVKALAAMIDRANSLGIPLVFIAKSSESRVFKKFLLGEISKGTGMKDQIRTELDSGLNDHYLIKSLATGPGYTRPIQQASTLGDGNAAREYIYHTTHILPDARDLPLKMDFVLPGDDMDSSGSLARSIISMAFWAYGGSKVHNLWLADIDRLVKFRKEEVEDIYMKTFEREIGISFYETRGERRARIRI